MIAETGVDFEEEFGKYAESAKNDGQTYMVPHNITSWALYYNKDVFDAAGVPYPDDTVPMTWEEYRETDRAKPLSKFPLILYADMPHLAYMP